MSDNTYTSEESVIQGPMAEAVEEIDADNSGHLAMGLFAGVILVLLVVIYAFASAA